MVVDLTVRRAGDLPVAADSENMENSDAPDGSPDFGGVLIDRVIPRPACEASHAGQAVCTPTEPSLLAGPLRGC
jgi:hypothetical protein